MFVFGGVFAKIVVMPKLTKLLLIVPFLLQRRALGAIDHHGAWSFNKVVIDLGKTKHLPKMIEGF